VMLRVSSEKKAEREPAEGEGVRSRVAGDVRVVVLRVPVVLRVAERPVSVAEIDHGAPERVALLLLGVRASDDVMIVVGVPDSSSLVRVGDALADASVEDRVIVLPSESVGESRDEVGVPAPVGVAVQTVNAHARQTPPAVHVPDKHSIEALQEALQEAPPGCFGTQ
jgi:hypothetical protein